MYSSAIFGLRFKSNEAIQPTLHDLNAFLESPKDGGKERHQDDLVKYIRQLSLVEEFIVKQKSDPALSDFNQRMMFGVFSHTHFFKPALKSAIEYYKYHYHGFFLIDLKKPLSFIKSAEDEIARLNPKKKDDQAKIARLRSLLDQRNEDLEAFKKRRLVFARELLNIGEYVAENLIKIRKLTESSISALVELQLGGEKESQLIEEIKTLFKDQVKGQLQSGPVTRQFVEDMKSDFEKLSKQLSKQILEDIYFMTRVYEAVHDHVSAFAGRLDALLNGIRGKRHEEPEEDRALFSRMGETLIDLVSDFNFERIETKVPESPLESGGHLNLLMKKRADMLDHLFELLEARLNGLG